MVYVTGYDHDIFVSYAHVDDVPPLGLTDGWVTALVKNLKNYLATELGKQEAFDLWFDSRLTSNALLTPSILGALEKTAILIVILSPSYLESKWCTRERETFLKLVGTRTRSGSHSRVFLVECLKVEEERPAQFGDLRTNRFWKDLGNGASKPIDYLPSSPDYHEHKYEDKLRVLAHDLSRELEKMRESSGDHGQQDRHQTPCPPDDKDSWPAVYLAEVTDDLNDLREAIKENLDQIRFRVLPDTWYSRAAPEFEAEVQRDLARSILFVQLLGGLPGKKPPSSTSSYAALQDRAIKHQNDDKAADVAKRLPILQWRSPTVELDRIADPEHRKLLESEHVQAVDFEAFKSDVRRVAEEERQRLSNPPGKTRPPTQRFVFINNVREDHPQAERLVQVLKQRGCAWALPEHKGKPEEIRKDLEANLLDCDGVIVLYGQITNIWVRDQLRHCQKMIWQRLDNPIRAVAIYEAPPEPKDPVHMGLQNLQVLKHRQGREDESLAPFLSAIGAT